MYEVAFVGDLSPAELFQDMNDFEKTWSIPDYAAVVVAFLALWHSIMYIMLGNPSCPSTLL